MTDFLTSLVRTYVPIVVGYLVSLGLLPGDLSDAPSPGQLRRKMSKDLVRNF